MHRVTLALLWIAFSTWYCYCLRPVEWLTLFVEPATAHPGIMSTLYRNRMDQLQAVIDAGVPSVTAKGLEIQQAGGTITFRIKKSRIPTKLHGGTFIADGNYPVFWITNEKEN